MSEYIDRLKMDIKNKLMGLELTEAEANEIIAAVKSRVRRCGAHREYDDIGCYLSVNHEGEHRARPIVKVART